MFCAINKCDSDQKNDISYQNRWLNKCVTKNDVTKMGVIIKKVLLCLILNLRVGHESNSTGAQYVAVQKKLID
jgi:hypothetical protein